MEMLELVAYKAKSLTMHTDFRFFNKFSAVRMFR